MKIKILLTLFLVSNAVFSQLDYKKYEGKKGKISFNKEYSYANIYDYKINASKEDSIISRKLSSSIPEGLLTDQYADKLSENKKDSISFELIMYSRLLVDINAERICLIKYKTRSNSNTSSHIIFKAKKTVGNWSNLVKSNKEIQLLEQILLDTNVDILFQFFNKKDSPKYTDINKLKPEVKDENGGLNIKKLAEIILNNKTVLQKYLKE